MNPLIIALIIYLSIGLLIYTFLINHVEAYEVLLTVLFWPLLLIMWVIFSGKETKSDCGCK